MREEGQGEHREGDCEGREAMRNRDEIMREWKRRAAHYEEQRDSYSEGWKDALDWAMGEVDMAKVYLKRVPEQKKLIGYMLLAAVFGAIIYAIIMAVGLKDALIILSIAAVAAAMICAGLELIF